MDVSRVIITHLETEGYVHSDVSRVSSAAPVCANLDKLSAAASSNTVWAVENVHHLDGAACCWGAKVRLRHLATGKLLAVD